MFRSIFQDIPSQPYDWERRTLNYPIHSNEEKLLPVFDLTNNYNLLYDPHIWTPINNIDWVKINPYWKHCTLIKEASNDLLQSIDDEIKEAIDNDQAVIILFGGYDAIKNYGLSPTKDLSVIQREARKLYNILPEYWKMYSYEEKANSIRQLQMLRNNDTELNKKAWSLQQWPHNLIRYCRLNDIKLIYIQADHTYCKFPSVFAEAMANTLYTHYRVLDGYNHCFKGNNNTLYCVGDSNVALNILQFIELNYSGSNIIGNNNILPDKYPILNPDINWVNMSDSYTNDVFTRILTGKPCCSSLSYFNYPWDIITKFSNQPIIPITITVNGKLVTGTFIKDIFPSDKYTHSLIPTKRFDNYDIPHPISFSGLHIPLSYIAPDGMSYKYNIPMYYRNRIVSNSIFYDGTYTCPSIFVDDVPVEQELKDKILFQSLAYEIHFSN